MWMLRGKRNRWGPGLASRAVDDLRLDEDGLSLYEIADKEDAQSIAAAHTAATVTQVLSSYFCGETSE